MTVDVFQMWGLLCYINVSIIHWEPLYSRLLTHKMIIHLTSKMLMLKEIRHLHHKEENTCFAFTKASFQKNELYRFCDLIILLRWFQWMEYNPQSSVAPTHTCFVLFKDYESTSTLYVINIWQYLLYWAVLIVWEGGSMQ